MSKKNDWKKREGVVYSTDSNFSFQYNHTEEAQTLPANQQRLLVQLDKSNRAGKQVTLVKGFVGSAADLDNLCKLLKTKCGTGGSAKDGEILIQGDVRDKLVTILQKGGYQARRGN